MHSPCSVHPGVAHQETQHSVNSCAKYGVQFAAVVVPVEEK